MSAPSPDPVIDGPAGARGSGFVAYPSFEGTNKGRANCERLAPDVCATALWQAVEKVHGSNFSITFGEGDTEPLFASRTQYLTKPFFNHLAVLEPHMPAIKRLVEHFRMDQPGARVQIFGELFGGSVQTVNRVFYCPTVDFIAFDLFVAGRPIHRDVMLAAFEQFGVPHLKPRARGKLADLLAMDPAFESEVRLLFGHDLPDGLVSNKAEGMVLQPVEPVTVMEDDSPVRIMLKHKNPTHMEVTLKQVKPPSQAAATKDAAPLDLTTLPREVQTLVEKAVCYVTLNRLGNYLSKIGAYDASMRVKTLSGLVQDAVIDFQKDLADAPSEKARFAKQQKHVRAFMHAQAVNVLDEYLVVQVK